MLGVLLRPFCFPGSPGLEKGAGFIPDLVQALAEHLGLEALTDVLGNGFQRGITDVDVVQLSSTAGKHGALLEHLHLDTHLEHVR